jgi:hypothetical protein
LYGITAGNEQIPVEVTDMLGHVIYRNTITATNGKINEMVSLTGKVANGMYLLNLHTELGNQVFHLVIEQ